MYKCRLCQQIFNNLNNIYNNRLKTLTQIILKLKGFKDSWDVNNALALCENCIKGVENVAHFWENIPEAKKETVDILGQWEQANTKTLFRVEKNLPAIQLLPQERHKYGHTTSAVVKQEPIKLRIKLPRRPTRKEQPESTNICIDQEPLQKRTRRCPQRYDDFQLTSTNSAPASISDNLASAEVSFTNLPHVALLRLKNGQHIGTLAELQSKAVSCNIRILCEICCQVYRVEKTFQTHLKEHFAIDGEPNADICKNYSFYCKLCEKSFPEHRAVRKHYKFAHSEERPFKCLNCDANFKYKFNLKYHISTKHECNKRFECKFCKKMFYMRYELEIHVRTHTKERPYKCEYCSCAFAHKSNLKSHQKVKHFQSSSNLTDFDESGKSFNLSRQFIPPEHMLEQEYETIGDSTLNKAVNNKNDVLTNEIFKHQELEGDQCDLNQQDSANTENSIFSSEQLNNPEIHLPQENVIQYDSNSQQDSESNNLETYENVVKNSRKENIENDYIEMNLKTENSEQTNVESESLLTNSGDDIISKVAASHESSDSFLKSPTKLHLQIDSSIFTVLPSTSILGLKKWPKSFQSVSSNNQLQVVKRDSTFFNREELKHFEMVETMEDFNKKSQMVMKNITQPATDCAPNPILKYKPSAINKSCKTGSSQMEHSATVLKSAQSTAGLTTSQINLEVSDSGNDKFINFINLSETFATKVEQKHLNDETRKSLNNSRIKDSSTTNALQSWKEIKISSRPVKIKNIFGSKQISGENIYKITKPAGKKNCLATEIPADKCLTNTTTKPNDTMFSNSALKTFTKNRFRASESLLKPITNNPPVTSLEFSNSEINQQTVLHNQPLITKIEILPPFKRLTTLQHLSSASTTNLIKPPSDYKFQCHYCYKYFKQKYPLTKHLRTHTGEKPYKCNICPKSYADASNYKKHKIVHKNVAEALNIGRKNYALQNSPAYSTVSDPDPDGIEIMQTLKKFESCNESDEDDDDIVDNESISSSNLESEMWQIALDKALNSVEIRENIKRNLKDFNYANLPKSMQHIANAIELKRNFSTEDPD